MKRRRPRRVPADGRGGGASDAGFTINSKTADPAAFEAAKKRQASRRARFEQDTGKGVIDLSLQRLFLPPMREMKDTGLLGAILGACDGSDNAESKPNLNQRKARRRNRGRSLVGSARRRFGDGTQEVAVRAQLGLVGLPMELGAHVCRYSTAGTVRVR